MSRRTNVTAAAAESRSVAVGMTSIMGSGVLFSFMSAFTRMASDLGMPSMEIVVVSGVVRWLGLVGTLVRSRESPLPPTMRVRILLLARSLCGLAAFSCATYSFGIMPLGDATSIFMTSPVWAALIARLVLGEKLKLVDVLANACAMAGVVLVARPPLLFGQPVPGPFSTTNATNATNGSADPASPLSSVGALVMLIGAMFVGSGACAVRLIKRYGPVHPAVIAHAYAFTTICVSPLGLLLPGQSPRVAAGLQDPLLAWLYCVGVGVLAVPNQLLFQAGLLRTPAGLGSMMRMVDVPSAFLLQVLLFGETPHLLSVIGAVVIVVCTAGSAYLKWREGGKAVAAASTTPALLAAAAADAPPLDAWVELNDVAVSQTTPK